MIVGDTGFEPATSWSQTMHASQLRQSPIGYRWRESNPHDFKGHKILSLACIPVPPQRQRIDYINIVMLFPNYVSERETGLEPATFSLARRRSTN